MKWIFAGSLTLLITTGFFGWLETGLAKQNLAFY
jgi:hypothetical protein